MSKNNINKVQALIVKQWLVEWNKVHFSDDKDNKHIHRKKPQPYFYLFNLSATTFRKLSEVYPRKPDKRRAEDLGIQRKLEQDRTEEIWKFINGGYPWSVISKAQKASEEYADLRMPGWLPTAIIANILPQKAKRHNKQLLDEECIKINKINDDIAEIVLPKGVNAANWNPSVYPMEIIDGQHRLWAFEELLEGKHTLKGDFELPVVAFYDLDVTWQAYLFYTINIKPKRINPSLAFDLYPLLRVQSWLEKSPEGPFIYRETRAQELTEMLWSHPESPWYKRINMLGEKQSGTITQAAFIRALIASYIKRPVTYGKSIGGLFGSQLSPDTIDVLDWNRHQQVAFLI